MRNLLSANLRRMFRSKLFWAAVILMFGLTTFSLLDQYGYYVKYGYESKLDNFIFGYVILIGMVGSVFFSLFHGTEYSDGTIRNKLIVGSTRSSIYFATLVTNIIGALAMCLAFVVSVCTVGVMLFGGIQADPLRIFRVLIGTILTVCAICGIQTAISMLISSKAVAAIVSILGMIFLMGVAAIVENNLSEPEFNPSGMLSYEDGEFTVAEEPTPNPAYVSGTKRIVFEYIRDINPIGQAFQYARVQAERPNSMLLYALGVTALSTGIGLFVFSKKNIK